ncbi:DNA repair protein RecO [Thalassospira sp.]|uniref:DNA repair protein RecO n=1 Tax=Thalassospira sp. TaxID=1912094 RepID=UPI002733228E|nr:DNA repair protein RecO [Thalassospira sp.]MDP2697835.1 DNA repair protein RecO [Thalassospira sp.]
MDWRDDGIVLSTHKLGENSVRLSVLTRDYGRYHGLVRGATGKNLRGTLEPGNEVRVSWSARLSEHLGHFKSEMTAAHAADLLPFPGPLLALSSACSLLEITLPERESHTALYHGTVALLGALKTDQWLASYIRWEVGLLEELGYGLQFQCCAATGDVTGLHFVSPKSGRAVSQQAGMPYRDKMLPLPAFLAGRRASEAAREYPMADQYRQGMQLTGHFIHRDIFDAKGVKPVAARDRLTSLVWRLEAT